MSPKMTVTNSEPKRGRGRPPGSKNKPKDIVTAEVGAVIVKKSRGRPKGSKNKPKDEQKPTILEPKKRGRKKKEQPAVVSEEPKKRRGRPPKVKAETQATVVAVEDKIKEHPLLEAVKWIEKSMHHTEVQYYRSRASKAGVTLHVAMASDILGFFNVQDPEINKQIKKNNFIATTHHGIHQQAPNVP